MYSTKKVSNKTRWTFLSRGYLTLFAFALLLTATRRY